jgi:hypothetical protein
MRRHRVQRLSDQIAFGINVRLPAIMAPKREEIVRWVATSQRAMATSTIVNEFSSIMLKPQNMDKYDQCADSNLYALAFCILQWTNRKAASIY